MLEPSRVEIIGAQDRAEIYILAAGHIKVRFLSGLSRIFGCNFKQLLSGQFGRLSYGFLLGHLEDAVSSLRVIEVVSIKKLLNGLTLE